jgi:hypothetical protein
VHTKESAAMALDQSALSELLDALRAGGDLDVVREALGLVLQATVGVHIQGVVPNPSGNSFEVF